MRTIIIYLSLCLTFFLHSCAEETVEMSQKGSIKGKVIKKGTNQPLANVKIVTSPTTETVFTGADGSFLIENVPIGDYSIKSDVSGYLPTFQGISLKSKDQIVSVVFELSDDNSLNSPPTTPILISPIDNAVDQPISVTLSWNATDPDPSDTLKYHLIVKNSINNNVLEFSNLTAKTHTLNNLSYGASYYWQVGVKDGKHSEVLSSIFTFKVSSNPNNRFHYVKKLNGNYYIVSSNETGQNFQYTTSNLNSFRPKLNNDANLIAFLRTVNGNNQIFTANRDGSNVQQVTTVAVAGFNNAELDFSWNKTGSQFIYPSFNKLYKINKDGSGLTQIYTTTDGSFITECDWSYDGSKIAIKTNNANGYGVKIFVIDVLGNTLNTVVSNVSGGAGGLNFSIDGNLLLFTKDVAGFEDSTYRQLDSRIYITNLTSGVTQDISALTLKPMGTNDLDPRFSPNDAEIIFVNTSNDNISPKNIIKVKVAFNSNDQRIQLFNDGEMPDWE